MPIRMGGLFSILLILRADFPKTHEEWMGTKQDTIGGGVPLERCGGVWRLVTDRCGC